MTNITIPAKPYGTPTRGISAIDVDRAADSLLRSGERPTVEKIRARLGTGSPNTINPLLDSWWKRLAGRLDAGPAALHRLPEAVLHVTESLWLQALEEARRRASSELGADQRAVQQAKDSYEVRSHVLSLREGELDSRLREKEREYADLTARLRLLTTLLKKEQMTREALTTQIAKLQRNAPPKRRRPSIPTQPPRTAKKKAQRASKSKRSPQARRLTRR